MQYTQNSPSGESVLSGDIRRTRNYLIQPALPLSGMRLSLCHVYHTIISVFDTEKPFTVHTFPRYNDLHANSFMCSLSLALSRIYNVKSKI